MVTSQSAGRDVEHLHLRESLHDVLEGFRSSLDGRETERSGRHDDVALAVQRVDERLGHGSPHEVVVGGQSRVNVDLVVGRNEGVDRYDRNALGDHLVDGVGQGPLGQRLDGDEVPVLRRHVLDGRPLARRAQLAVEPCDVDVEQLAPVFRCFLPLRAPRDLKPGVGEGGLEGLT